MPEDLGIDWDAAEKRREEKARAAPDFIDWDAAEKRREAKASAESRGLVGDLLSGTVRGVTGRMPETHVSAAKGIERTARKLLGLDEKGPVGEFADKATEGITQFHEKSPFLRAKEKPNWLTQALESVTQSLSVGAPGALVGAGIRTIGKGAGPAGILAGAWLGYASEMGIEYGFAEYQNFIDAADKAGIKREDSEPAAMISGFVEGGFEFGSALLSGRIMSNKAFKSLTTPAKEAIKTGIGRLFKVGLKEHLLKGAAVTISETSSELLTAGFQAEQYKKVGLGDKDFWGGVTEAFGPAFGASVIFSAIFTGGLALHRRKIQRHIENGAVDPKVRMQAAAEVEEVLRGVDPNVAEAWKVNAAEAIKENRDIPIDKRDFITATAEQRAYVKAQQTGKKLDEFTEEEIEGFKVEAREEIKAEKVEDTKRYIMAGVGRTEIDIEEARAIGRNEDIPMQEINQAVMEGMEIERMILEQDEDALKGFAKDHGLKLPWRVKNPENLAFLVGEHLEEDGSQAVTLAGQIANLEETVVRPDTDTAKANLTAKTQELESLMPAKEEVALAKEEGEGVPELEEGRLYVIGREDGYSLLASPVYDTNDKLEGWKDQEGRHYPYFEDDKITNLAAKEELPTEISPEVAEPGGVLSEKEQIAKVALSEVEEQGRVFKTGQAVTFKYFRGKAPAPDQGERFQQHIEPAGRYLIHNEEADTYVKSYEDTPATKGKYESGEVEFKNPLVIPLNTEHGEVYNENSWKVKLTEAYGGLTGQELSQAIVNDGFDGIVTTTPGPDGTPYETREIVDLTGFKATRPPVEDEPAAPEAAKEPQPEKIVDDLMKSKSITGDAFRLGKKLFDGEVSQEEFDAAEKQFKDMYSSMEKGTPEQADASFRHQFFDEARRMRDALQGKEAPPAVLEAAKKFQEPTEKAPAEPTQPEKQYTLGKSVPVLAGKPLIDEIKKSNILGKSELGVNEDGSVWWRNEHGLGGTIKSVEHITPNKVALRALLGKHDVDGVKIEGVTEGMDIIFEKDAGNRWTVAHEFVHIAKKAGLVKDTEWQVLTNKVRNNILKGKLDWVPDEFKEILKTKTFADLTEDQKEDFVAYHVQDATKTREGTLWEGGTKATMQKIADFFDMLVNKFIKPTARGVVRSFEKGDILAREATKTAEAGAQFAVGKEPTELITKPVRDFAAKMKSDIEVGVKEKLKKVEAYKNWKWDVGDRVLSDSTEKAYKITGRSWDKRTDKPLYMYESVDGEEKGTFRAEMAHEGMKRFEGPQFAIQKKQGPTLKEYRAKIASGTLQEGTPEYDKAFKEHGKNLQGHLIRRKKGTIFNVGKSLKYGPVRKPNGELKKGIVEKEVEKEHPILGKFKRTEHYDEAGNRIIDGPIFSETRSKRLKEIEEIVNRRREETRWYEDWNQHMEGFVKKGMPRKEVEKHIKIQAVLSAQRGPQGNQQLYTRVVNRLKETGAVSAGSIESGGVGVDEKDAEKINEIWSGFDNYNTLEERIARYGGKVGPYMTAGLDPYHPGAVVIDRHMPRAWGHDVSWSAKPTGIEKGDFHKGFYVSPKLGRQIADDIVEVAEKMGVPPAGVQAAVWFETRPPDVEAKSYHEASVLGPEYMPTYLVPYTEEERRMMAHYGSAAYQTIRGSGLEEAHNAYSENDVGRRKRAHTEEDEYVPGSYFYATGVPKEPFVGRYAHLAETPPGIYDGINDPKGIAKMARLREQSTGGDFDNIFSKIVRNNAYIGFSYQQAPDRKAFFIFEPVDVMQSVEATVAVSDVMQAIETKFPQDFEKAKALIPVRFAEFRRYVDETMRYVPELSKISSDPAIAKFKEATGDRLELSMVLKVSGPIESVKTLAALLGTARRQNYVYVMHTEGMTAGTATPDQGLSFTSKIKSDLTEADVKKALDKHNLTDYNIRVSSLTEDLYIEQFFGYEWTDDETIDRFRDFLADVEQPGHPVNDVVEARSEAMVKKSDDLEDKYLYENQILKYFGETEGRELYDYHDKQGQAWEDALKDRQKGAQYAIRGTPDADTRKTFGPGQRARIQRAPPRRGYHKDLRGDRYYLTPTEKEEAPEPPPPAVPTERPQYAIQKQADVWHSKMENFLSEKLPGKGPAKQLKNIITNWAEKGQFKKEELEWSGLKEWLDDRSKTYIWTDQANELDIFYSVMDRAYFVNSAGVGIGGRGGRPGAMGGYETFDEARDAANEVVRERKQPILTDLNAPGEKFDPLKILLDPRPYVPEKAYVNFKPQKPKPVTKQELLDYLKASNYRVEEVLLGDEGYQGEVPEDLIHEDSLYFGSPRNVDVDYAWIEDETEAQIEMIMESLEEDDIYHDEEGNVDEDKVREDAEERAHENWYEYGQSIEVVEQASGWSVRYGNSRDVFEIFNAAGEYVDQLDYNVDLNDAMNKVFESLWEEGLVISQDQIDEMEESGVKHAKYVEPGGKEYKELLITMPSREGELYTGGHYGEYPDTILHVRFDERDGPNGEKILHIAEIQSDLHQDARRNRNEEIKRLMKGGVSEDEARKQVPADFGYKTGKIDTTGWYMKTVPDEMQKPRKVVFNQHDVAVYDLGPGWRDSFPGEGIQVAAKRRSQFGVPDAPFKQTQAWQLLAMKRMVRYAAENDFDMISWDSGAIQAGRYENELRKKVDAINWVKVGERPEKEFDKKDGKEIFAERLQEWTVTIRASKGGMVVFDKKIPLEGTTPIAGKDVDLEGVVGKEMARKIRESKKGSGLFEGEDLTIGGEAFKMFYDYMLPDSINKFFNKKDWGNARVGLTDLGGDAIYRVAKAYGTPGGPIEGDVWYKVIDPQMNTIETFNERAEAQKEADLLNKNKGLGGRTVQALPVTPEMKEKALYEGMPQFALRRKGQDRDTIGAKISDDIAFKPKAFDFTKDDAKDFAAKLYHLFVMKEYPIVRLAKKAGDADLVERINKQIRRRRGESGMSEVILTSDNVQAVLSELENDGITEYRHITESLGSILSGLKSEAMYKDYERMRVYERDLALAMFRPDPEGIADSEIKGVNKKKAEKVLAYLKQKYGETEDGRVAGLSEISDKHREFERQAILRPLVESGWMSEEQYDNITGRPESEYYASFLREMEEAEMQIVGRGKEVVKKIYGSERKKLPSTEGTIANLARTVKIVEELRLNKMIVEIRESGADFADMIQEIPPSFRSIPGTWAVYEAGNKKQAKRVFQSEGEARMYAAGLPGSEAIKRPGGSIAQQFKPEGSIVVAEDGKKKYYSVPKDIQKAQDTHTTEEIHTVMKVLGAPARLLRAGATLSAEFIMRNPVRDQFSAMVYSKYGYNFFTDFGKGVFSMVAHSKSGGKVLKGAGVSQAAIDRGKRMYEEFKAAGGEMSYFVSLDRQKVHMKASQLTGYNQGFKWSYANPVEALRVLSEMMEKGTRLGLYSKAKTKGATPGEAMTEARGATLDFGRIGQLRALNQVIAFWNANVQGTVKMRQELLAKPRKDPKSWKYAQHAITRAALGITVPSILLWALNHDDERYKALPEWQKNFFWIIPVGTDGPIIRIPKPFEMGLIFGSLPERILDYLYTNDVDEVKSIATALKDGAVPGMIPTAALPLLEHMTNYSFFRERRLESQTLQRLPAEMRYTPFTSEAAKTLGQIVNISPVMIENWIRDWSGSLGYTAVAALDPLLESKKVPEVGKKWYEATPGIRGFIARDPRGSSSKTTNKFYDYLEKASQTDAGHKLLLKSDRVEAKKYFDENKQHILAAKRARKDATAIANLRKQQYRVMDSMKSSEQKRIEIDEVNRRISDVAERFNGWYRARGG